MSTIYFQYEERAIEDDSIFGVANKKITHFQPVALLCSEPPKTKAYKRCKFTTTFDSAEHIGKTIYCVVARWSETWTWPQDDCPDTFCGCWHVCAYKTKEEAEDAKRDFDARAPSRRHTFWETTLQP